MCVCAHRAVVARIGSVSDGNFSMKDVRIKATKNEMHTLSRCCFSIKFLIVRQTIGIFSGSICHYD